MKRAKKRGPILIAIIFVLILIAGILLGIIYLKEKQIKLSPEITQTKKTTYIYAGNLLASKTIDNSND